MTVDTEIYDLWGIEGNDALVPSGTGCGCETAGLSFASVGSKEIAPPSDRSCENTTTPVATMSSDSAIVPTELHQRAALDAWATDGGSFR